MGISDNNIWPLHLVFIFLHSLFMITAMNLKTIVKPLLWCLLTVAGIGAMQGCDIETSSKGNLYGYWHLCRIDTIGAGECDMTQKKAFWAIQANVVEITDREYVFPQVIFSFKQQNDSLLLSNPLLKDRYNQDPKFEDVSQLAFYGIDTLNPEYFIEILSSDKMTLANDKVKLYFKKL